PPQTRRHDFCPRIRSASVITPIIRVPTAPLRIIRCRRIIGLGIIGLGRSVRVPVRIIVGVIGIVVRVRDGAERSPCRKRAEPDSYPGTWAQRMRGPRHGAQSYRSKNRCPNGQPATRPRKVVNKSHLLTPSVYRGTGKFTARCPVLYR